MIKNNLARVLAIRREIMLTRPNVVITFGDTTNVKTLIGTLGLKVPVIICEQVDPLQYSIGRIWDTLRKVIYPMATIVVVVSSVMAKAWAEHIVRRERIRVVPNPVYIAAKGSAVRGRKGPCYTIAAMGRLVPQKGFDYLLRAFQLCSARHSEWSLSIIGEGSDRHSLEDLRSQLGLAEKVRFLGTVKEPSTLLRQADLFVLSSRFEGFPLALIEAMACGLPVISVDCPTGPAEIIRNGIDGLLVRSGDVSALADAMDRLMSDANERESLASRAVEVVERFGVDKITGLWDEVLKAVVGTSCEGKMPSHSMMSGK